MNSQLPIPITDESDLNYYEQYLNQELSTVTNAKVHLYATLNAYIGKLVKIDFTGIKPESRMGKLSQVGDDFLIIKSNNQSEIIIPITSVKFLTVLQNNTKLPHF